jgi:hypothetical protein
MPRLVAAIAAAQPPVPPPAISTSQLVSRIATLPLAHRDFLILPDATSLLPRLAERIGINESATAVAESNKVKALRGGTANGDINGTG